MIIPVRCFTCGKVLADKYNYFSKKAEEIDEEHKKKMLAYYMEDDEEIKKQILNKDKTFKNIEPTYKKEILDELGLHKMCCRRHMLSHIDMVGKI